MIIIDILNQVFGVGTPFVASVSGDWNNGATWGNAGNVKGTDYPGNAGNVWTINASIVVKYNVVETNALGTGVINGTLWFPRNASTKLTMGDADLTIGATGSIFTSSDGTVGNIGAVANANTMSVIWNTTADNTNGLTITQGAYVNIQGDPALYGSTVQTTLQAAWSSGQTFTVVGSGADSWVAGQTIHVSNNRTTTSSVYQYTIASTAANGANTDITINEAASGTVFNADGLVYVVDRNVKIYKLGAETPTLSQAFTLRPRIADNHTSGTVIWKDVQFTGLNRYTGTTVVGGTFTFDNCVMRNGNYSFYMLTLATLTNCIACGGAYGFNNFTSCTLNSCIASAGTYGFSIHSSCTHNTSIASGITGNGGFLTFTYCDITDCIANCCATGFNTFSLGSMTNCIIRYCTTGLTTLSRFTMTDCTIKNCSTGLTGATLCTLSGCVINNNTTAIVDTMFSNLVNCDCYSNGLVIQSSQSLSMIGGSFGWNGETPAANTADIKFPTQMQLRNVKIPDADLVYTSRDTATLHGAIRMDDFNQTVNAWRVDGAHYTATKELNPADSGFLSPDGYCFKVVPLSSISDPTYTPFAPLLGGWLIMQEEGMLIHCPSRQVTLKIRVQTHAYDSMPTHDQLYFVASYYGTGASTTMTDISTQADEQVVAANDTTQVFTLTFTPVIAGKVILKGYLTLYDADGYILIDPSINW